MAIIRNITTKAEWGEHLTLAKYVASKKFSPADVMEWLKNKHYKVQNKFFRATTVSAMLEGIQSVEPAPAPAMELEQAIAMVNAAITDGKLKYTKAKQVHAVPVKATKQTQEDDDVPF